MILSTDDELSRMELPTLGDPEQPGILTDEMIDKFNKELDAHYAKMDKIVEER